MAQNRIYVVAGSTGEYDDYREWPVCYYANREAAEMHVTLAQKEADELFKKYGKYGTPPDGANKYDPEFSVDYTGTSYCIWELTEGLAAVSK